MLTFKDDRAVGEKDTRMNSFVGSFSIKKGGGGGGQVCLKGNRGSFQKSQVPDRVHYHYRGSRGEPDLYNDGGSTH